MTVVWFTGIPGAGKSTTAGLVLRALLGRRVRSYLLDGDAIRRGLSSDLGFSDRDRTENVRRVAHVAKMMADAGVLTLVAMVSPFENDRQAARRLIGADRFIEVHVDVPFEIAAARDPKGLYSRARLGEVSSVTGLDSRYEPPTSPVLRLKTSELSEQEAATSVLALLERRGVVP